MSKELVCCFTGHRDIDDKMLLCIPAVLKPLLSGLSERGVKIFRAGGARGFDNVASLNVMLLKTKSEGVKLDLMLPCPDQDSKWKWRDKRDFRRVISGADSIVYAEECYTRDCYHKRNRMLVDGSDFCIAYYDGEPSGTGYTVDYAKKKGVYVINIYPMVLEECQRRYGK